MAGKKDVEIRAWASRYRGPLWIHTGKKVDEMANARFKRENLVTGAVLGWVQLTGIRPFSAEGWEAWRSRHLDDAPFDEKACKYGWIIRSAVLLSSPVNAKGRLKLFCFEEEVLAQLEAAASNSKTPLIGLCGESEQV